MTSLISINEKNTLYSDEYNLKENTEFLKAIDNYMKNICNGPTHICTCYGTLLFSKQIIKYIKKHIFRFHRSQIPLLA